MVMLSETPTDRDTMVLNMGPQHPATHGVLRLLLEMEGETILHATPDVGFLHTGIEKTMEARNYHQAIVLTDRTDYLTPMSNNLSYLLACEKLFGVEHEIPTRAMYVRVILTELQRIASHLVAVGSQANDLGAVTVLVYCFRDREAILSIFELVSGVRMMTSFFRIGGLAADVPPGFEEQVRSFLRTLPSRLDDYETLLNRNPIFLDRTVGVGQVSAEDLIAMSVTGPVLRAAGVPYDVRRAFPYCRYDEFEFDVPTRTESDVYARYLVRMEEMRQSMRIVEQALARLEPGEIRINNPRIAFPKREKIHRSMESLIHHFKLVAEGPRPPQGEAYAMIESPRGEQATYVFSNGTNMPHRVRFRGPSFCNVQALPLMIDGRLVADVVSAVGSADFILGEVDR